MFVDFARLHEFFSRRVVKCFPRFLFQICAREARFTKFNLKPTENSPKPIFCADSSCFEAHMMILGCCICCLKIHFQGDMLLLSTPFHIAPNLFHQIRRFWKSVPQKRSVIKSLKMILKNLTTFIMCKHFQLIQISGIEWIRRFHLVPLKSFATPNAPSSKRCGCFTGGLAHWSSQRAVSGN